MSDPMEPLQKLMEAFNKEIEPLGLHVHTFALLPNPDGPPHMVQAMLTFDGKELEEITAAAEGDPLKDGELTLEEKDIFDSLERDLTRSTADEEAEATAAALQRLQESLEKGSSGGILGDDD